MKTAARKLVEEQKSNVKKEVVAGMQINDDALIFLEVLFVRWPPRCHWYFFSSFFSFFKEQLSTNRCFFDPACQMIKQHSTLIKLFLSCKFIPFEKGFFNGHWKLVIFFATNKKAKTIQRISKAYDSFWSSTYIFRSFSPTPNWESRCVQNTQN